MPTMIQMKRRAVSDILAVIERIRYASELSKAKVLYSKVMTEKQATLMDPGNVVAFLYLEQYYQRAEGKASLSILITQEEDVQMVMIISPTTRNTLILDRADIDLGKKVKKVLEEIGFEPAMYWDDFSESWESWFDGMNPITR